jgi:hypothetical protein
MHGYCISEDSEHGLRLFHMGSLEHLVIRLAPSTSPFGLNFSIFKLHTDFINFGTFPNTFSMSMRHFKIGRGWKVRGQRGHVHPTTIVVVAAVA